jgi:hypothetical protein
MAEQQYLLGLRLLLLSHKVVLSEGCESGSGLYISSEYAQGVDDYVWPVRDRRAGLGSSAAG